MLIDLFFLLIMLMAIVKGLRQGLIIGLFSLLGWIIGLAAAMKLSALAAEFMKDSLNISSRWLPALSFLAVFILVMLLVRLGAGLIEKTIQLGLMGWANRIGGLILYLLLYSVMFSIILFFAVQLKLIKEDTLAASKVYPYIKPLGQQVIDGLGNIIPLFKNTFAELEDFFEKISHRLPE
ncbi:MAG: CvpA family protein [Flavitalea sp.]